MKFPHNQSTKLCPTLTVLHPTRLKTPSNKKFHPTLNKLRPTKVSLPSINEISPNHYNSHMLWYKVPKSKKSCTQSKGSCANIKSCSQQMICIQIEKEILPNSNEFRSGIKLMHNKEFKCPVRTGNLCPDVWQHLEIFFHDFHSVLKLSTSENTRSS